MNRYMRSASLDRVLLLVTKKFAQGVYLNSNLRSKLFGTPTTAESKSKTQFKMKLSKLFRISLLYFAFFCTNCSSDYTENLGNGYFFVGEGEPLNKILNEKSGRGVIPENVNDYDFDKNFIIAKQKPELPQSIIYEKKYEYKYGPNEYYYWLIVKDEYLVLGPFNLAEFNEKRQMYKVPETLELKK